MTATVVSHCFDCEVTNKNCKVMTYNSTLSGSQLHSVSPTSTSTNTPFTPHWSLLDRKVVGPLMGLYQRRHSVSVTSSKSMQNQFITSLQLYCSASIKGNNKDNRLRDRSYSETGDCLRPSHITCICANGNSQINSSRYKTELCRPFEENGTCKYGDKCQFAHGMHELRSLNRHPKYKTEFCRTFHSIGYCPYGPRCHFIHNAEERHGPPPSSTFNKMKCPGLYHSYSFAGFPSSSGSQESPTSLTPPPMFSAEEIIKWPSNPFTYSNQVLTNLFGPSLSGTIVPELSGPHSPTPTSFFRPVSPTPPDSLSDEEGYQSSVGSHSGSESPVLDATHRLPIFSRLSISED